MKLLQKSVFANLGMGLAGRLFSQLFSFFIVVYLARILGPADYGDISLALALVSYFSLLASFGLPTIGTREVARAQTDSRDAVSVLFSLRVGLAISLYSMLVLYGVFFVSNQRLFYLLVLYGLTMVSSACLLDWFFVGMEDLQSITVANLLGTIVSCSLVFLWVKDATNIYFIPMFSFVGSVITCCYLLNLYRKVQSLHFCFNRAQFLALLRAAMPFAIAGFLSQVYENMDMILLGYFVGSEEVGYYSVAYKIVVVLSSIIAIYSQSTWPVMIRLLGSNKQQVGEFLKQNIHTMLYFMIPVITGGTILAHNLITVFFGEAYAPAVIPFVLLLYYVFFMALSITMANLLLAVKQDKSYLGALALGAIANVSGNLILIPYWRATGSAVAMVIAELIVFFCLLTKVRPLYNENWIDYKFLFFAIGSSGVMGVGVFGIQRLFHFHVGFMILAGILIYVGVSWPFCSKFIRRASQL